MTRKSHNLTIQTMTKDDTKKIAFNWRWLRILLPLWIIFGGIPLIIIGPTDWTTIMTVMAIAFIAALAATAFCVKCFLFYLEEYEKQKPEQQGEGHDGNQSGKE